jgi:hypothetical protein
MDGTVAAIGIALGVLQIISILVGWFKFYTRIQVNFTKIEGRIGQIEAQYVPNGGSSMKDSLNRIESKIAKLEGRFEQHVDEGE